MVLVGSRKRTRLHEELDVSEKAYSTAEKPKKARLGSEAPHVENTRLKAAVSQLKDELKEEKGTVRNLSAALEVVRRKTARLEKTAALYISRLKDVKQELVEEKEAIMEK